MSGWWTVLNLTTPVAQPKFLENHWREQEKEMAVLMLAAQNGYESFDLSKTHFLLTQDFQNFDWLIDSFITMTAGENFSKQKTAFKKSRKLAIK